MGIDVSIIIPVFNKDKYLAQCLDSVIGQSFTNIEIICIDDASDDQSGEILRQYAECDSRIQIITNTKNLGAAQSRNIGIDASTGTFLRFVDADDLLPHKSIEALYLRAVEDNVELVKGSLGKFKEDDLSTLQIVSKIPDIRHTKVASEQHLWIPWWHNSFLISTDLVQRNNLHYPELISGEDPVFIASVLVNTKYFSSISDTVYLYRKYPKQCGSGGNSLQHLVDFIRHAAIIKDLYQQHNPNYWQRGYRLFLLRDIQNLVHRCKLNPEEKKITQAEIRSIWNNEQFYLRLIMKIRPYYLEVRSLLAKHIRKILKTA